MHGQRGNNSLFGHKTVLKRANSEPEYSASQVEYLASPRVVQTSDASVNATGRASWGSEGKVFRRRKGVRKLLCEAPVWAVPAKSFRHLFPVALRARMVARMIALGVTQTAARLNHAQIYGLSPPSG